jgi:hypothetical protein
MVGCHHQTFVTKQRITAVVPSFGFCEIFNVRAGFGEFWMSWLDWGFFQYHGSAWEI